MKTCLITTLMLLSMAGHAQVDSSSTDTVKCLPARPVLHCTALAFVVFYNASAHGFAKSFKQLIHSSKPSNYEKNNVH